MYKVSAKSERVTWETYEKFVKVSLNDPLPKSNNPFVINRGRVISYSKKKKYPKEEYQVCKDFRDFMLLKNYTKCSKRVASSLDQCDFKCHTL